MSVRANGRAVLAWTAAFSALYLALAVTVSLAAGPYRHMTVWLVGALFWLVSEGMSAGIGLGGGGVTEPHPRSAAGQARITALRWVLCGLLLANAALQVWRAFRPGDSTLDVVGVGIRVLPLDFRLTATGLDPLALLIGLALAALGLSELRLRLVATARAPSKPAATLI
jgi:hypothetical protein